MASSGKIKYPSSFYNYSNKLDLIKINKPILQLWITNEITSLLGFDDEIVTNTVINLFGLSTNDDGTSNADNSTLSSQQLNETIDPKQAHVVLSGFFNEDVAFQFCIKLWDYMIDASQQSTGIPRQIIEAKKRQLQQEKQLQSLASTTNASPLKQQPEKLLTSKSSQQQPKQRRNRWDNNDMAEAVNNHYVQDQQSPNIHNIVPSDTRSSNDNYNRNNNTAAFRDEYGRSRNHERERPRDDTIYSPDRPRRRYDDDVDDIDYRSRRDEERHRSRRRNHIDRSSSDRRDRDRHDDDYYHDNQHKRKRHY